MLFEQLRPRNTPAVIANAFYGTLYMWGDGHDNGVGNNIEPIDDDSAGGYFSENNCDNIVYANSNNDTLRGHSPNERILGRDRHGTLDENHDGTDRLPDANANDGFITNAGMGLHYGGSRSRSLIS
ncbi:MAG: hypothetical protein KatS3mg104_0921 [Phycisphaerae bacterium]|jgi:hypothetical protein|nr:MAG: hypothetical protein KatS3mg104_0921 [Phycisphaerae bacterium]